MSGWAIHMVNFVLVPGFAQDVLKRNHLPLSAFLDFKTLRGVMSVNDIVLAAALQDQWTTLCGPEVQYYSNHTLETHWMKTATPTDQKFLNEVIFRLARESGKSINKEMEERLFDSALKGSTDQMPYKIYDLQSELYGIVIYPGFVSDSRIQNKLVEDIVKSLYVYCAHHQVAESPFFARYLTCLQKSAAMA